MAKPALMKAASTLLPYRQGELDSLCGLYATINALHLAAALSAPMPLRHANTLSSQSYQMRALSITPDTYAQIIENEIKAARAKVPVVIA